LHQIPKIDAIAATYCIIFEFDARGRDAIGSKFSSASGVYFIAAKFPGLFDNLILFSFSLEYPC
jgi:hypothetical protein